MSKGKTAEFIDGKTPDEYFKYIDQERETLLEQLQQEKELLKKKRADAVKDANRKRKEFQDERALIIGRAVIESLTKNVSWIQAIPEEDRPKVSDILDIHSQRKQAQEPPRHD